MKTFINFVYLAKIRSSILWWDNKFGQYCISEGITEFVKFRLTKNKRYTLIKNY